MDPAGTKPAVTQLSDDWGRTGGTGLISVLVGIKAKT